MLTKTSSERSHISFTSQTSSQDVSALCLSHISKLQVSSNPIFWRPTATVASNTGAPIYGYKRVLVCGSGAESCHCRVRHLGSRMRKYLLLTQPCYSSHRRACIRPCMIQEGSLLELQRTAHSLHTLLRLSIVLYLLRLVMLTSDGGHLIVVAVGLYKYSMMPYFYPQSLCSAPLSCFLLSLKVITFTFQSHYASC